ncbi:membrane protein [Beggiatoa sp. PS]|nr:membrane protein [Beggiatoa sp. PS]
MVKTVAKPNESLLLSYLLFFVLTYIAILAYTASQVHIDPIQSRYLSPIYFYFFLFIFISFKNTLHLLKMERANKYFYNSLQIVLYSLVLATFLTYAKDYTQSIKNIFQKQHTAAYYSEAGFKLSTTSKKFNSYFKNRFTQHDQLYVSVIDRYRYNAVGAFFFRESIINDPIFKHLSFENVKPHEGDVWSPNFTISFYLNDRQKSLIYRNLYRPINAKQLIKAIRHLFKTETNSFLLIVDKDWEGKDFYHFQARTLK